MSPGFREFSLETAAEVQEPTAYRPSAPICNDFLKRGLALHQLTYLRFGYVHALRMVTMHITHVRDRVKLLGLSDSVREFIL